MEQLQEISIDRIDDPQLLMRSVMNDEKLDELARSIKTQGLIQPITVRKVGERYELIAGKRRLTACTRIGLVVVPAIVHGIDEKAADGMRMHENLYREDINPVDEARYIRRMIDTHGMDPADLAAATGKSETYLQARYEILDFPDYLIQALELEQIGLTAAQWLMKIRDENVRKEYTRFAMLGGITAKRAEAWFRSWEAGSLPREASAFAPPPVETSAEPVKLTMPCVLCRHMDELDNLRMTYVHQDCDKAAAEMQRNV